VAQDAFNISADRGLSSFDQKHKFTGSWMYDLPFGENHRLASKGTISHVLNGCSGAAARQLDRDFISLRSSRRQRGYRPRGQRLAARESPSGQAISLSNPTSLEWFNYRRVLRADNLHCLRESGRVRIRRCRSFYHCRPGQFSLNMALNKTIQIHESRSLDLRFQANNVFNIVQSPA